MTKYCPECLSDRHPNDTYCWSCGSKLITEPPLRCPECGEPQHPVNRFCPKCGTKVK